MKGQLVTLSFTWFSGCIRRACSQWFSGRGGALNASGVLRYSLGNSTYTVQFFYTSISSEMFWWCPPMVPSRDVITLQTTSLMVFVMSMVKA
uniref:Putative secreted protein n=1 Tax=Ixodes ricinus TaxID=34613 RepID=A0A6B0UC04_IXORI